MCVESVCSCVVSILHLVPHDFASSPWCLLFVFTFFASFMFSRTSNTSASAASGPRWSHRAPESRSGVRNFVGSLGSFSCGEWLRFCSRRPNSREANTMPSFFAFSAGESTIWPIGALIGAAAAGVDTGVSGMPLMLGRRLMLLQYCCCVRACLPACPPACLPLPLPSRSSLL
jgi:hypothetical protein